MRINRPPRTSFGALNLIFALIVGSASLPAQSPIRFCLSPDIDISLGELAVSDKMIVIDLGGGNYTDGGAPLMGPLQALDHRANSTLVCLESVAGLEADKVVSTALPVFITDGAPADELPSGLVLGGGIASALADQSGQSAGLRCDALTIVQQPNGDSLILLSWDTSVTLPGNSLVDYEVLWGAGEIFFDGSEAGVDPALDLDAAHYLATEDALLLSFDASGVLGNVAFDDEDVLRFDRSQKTWTMAYNASNRNAAWESADLTALFVDRAQVVESTPPVITSITPNFVAARVSPLRIEVDVANLCSASQVEVTQRVSSECLASLTDGDPETLTLDPAPTRPPPVFAAQNQALTSITVELPASVLTNRNCSEQNPDVKSIVVVNPSSPGDCATVAGRSQPQPFFVTTASVPITPNSMGPALTQAGVVNAASFLAGGVSPGEIVSLFGSDLGPAVGLQPEGFDPDTGLLATTLGAVSVSFNGVPAPLFFVRQDQINL